MDERPIFEPMPAEFKTACDGRAGLVKVTFVGPPHAGHALYIDEPDLPGVIYTTGTSDRFEWWTEPVHEAMAKVPAGADHVRHELRVAEDTREPTFVSSRVSSGS
jgi:hypothetical protein